MILSLEKLRKDYKLYRKKDLEIIARINILLEFSKIELKYDGANNQSRKKVETAAFYESMEISERTIQRWKEDYIERGPDGLGKLKATGRPPVAIRRRIRRVITAYRKMFRWGSEVIQAHLKHDHSYEVSRHKIELFLGNSGLRDKYPCTTKKRQRAEKKKKHTSVVKVNDPGTHTQIDVKYQLHLLENKQKSYVYNIVDHASNWSFKRAYSAINANNTRDFMEKLLKVCPFTLIRVQSDNGVEFTYKYVSISDDPKEHPLDTFCSENSIVHKLVPPGEKELQGLVERSHRQDDQELFSRITPKNLNEFNKKLEEFYKLRNKRRRFKKLGWKTPDEWLEKYNLSALVTLLLVTKKFGQGQNSSESSELLNFENSIRRKEDECKKLKKSNKSAVNIGKLAA